MCVYFYLRSTKYTPKISLTKISQFWILERRIKKEKACFYRDIDLLKFWFESIRSNWMKYRSTKLILQFWSFNTTKKEFEVSGKTKMYAETNPKIKHTKKIRKFCQIGLTTPNENRALSAVYSKELTWNRRNLFFGTFISSDKGLIKTKSYLIERELQVGHWSL